MAERKDADFCPPGICHERHFLMPVEPEAFVILHFSLPVLESLAFLAIYGLQCFVIEFFLMKYINILMRLLLF